jgi:hypothetical protein
LPFEPPVADEPPLPPVALVPPLPFEPPVPVLPDLLPQPIETSPRLRRPTQANFLTSVILISPLIKKKHAARPIGGSAGRAGWS